MKFGEICRRLTGFSTPVFGLNWEPGESDRSVAARVISFLEDRRVLYNPSDLELPEHCVRSVIEIRHFLSHELGSLDRQGPLAQSLNAMRTACRKFLDFVQRDEDLVRHGARPNHWASWHFNSAVGELRGVFGIHIAQIAAQHGHDVEGDLASILPSRAD